jgi:hypothetical protein
MGRAVALALRPPRASVLRPGGSTGPRPPMEELPRGGVGPSRSGVHTRGMRGPIEVLPPGGLGPGGLALRVAPCRGGTLPARQLSLPVGGDHGGRAGVVRSGGGRTVGVGYQDAWAWLGHGGGRAGPGGRGVSRGRGRGRATWLRRPDGHALRRARGPSPGLPGGDPKKGHRHRGPWWQAKHGRPPGAGLEAVLFLNRVGGRGRARPTWSSRSRAARVLRALRVRRAASRGCRAVGPASHGVPRIPSPVALAVVW